MSWGTWRASSGWLAAPTGHGALGRGTEGRGHAVPRWARDRFRGKAMLRLGPAQVSEKGTLKVHWTRTVLNSRGALSKEPNRKPHRTGSEGPVTSVSQWARSSCEDTPVILRACRHGFSPWLCPQGPTVAAGPQQTCCTEVWGGRSRGTPGSACGGRGATPRPVLTSRRGGWHATVLQRPDLKWDPYCPLESFTHSSLIHCPSFLPRSEGTQRNDNKGQTGNGAPPRILPSPCRPGVPTRRPTFTPTPEGHTQSGCWPLGACAAVTGKKGCVRTVPPNHLLGQSPQGPGQLVSDVL